MYLSNLDVQVFICRKFCVGATDTADNNFEYIK